MLQGILDLYKLMRDKFKATPAHSHYIFTLHDIGHIVEGMLLLSPRKTKSKPRRARAKKDGMNATTLLVFAYIDIVWCYLVFIC